MGISRTDQRLSRIAFFDCDGTLIDLLEKDHLSARNVNEVSFKPGSFEIVEYLRHKGFICVLITNQPDVSRGLVTEEQIEEVHQFVQQKLGISFKYVCYHDDHAKCDCRKPKIGMLIQAARELSVDLSDCIYIGDSWRDIQAANDAGACSILVTDQKFTTFNQTHQPQIIASNLVTLVEILSEALHG